MQHWGRDLALYLGRVHGRLTLAELGKLAGGLDYGSVQMAVQRLTQRLRTDQALRKIVARFDQLMLDVAM